MIRPNRNSVAHGKPPQFATLNHAAVDSGIPRVSHSADWYNIRQSLYSDLVVALGLEPQAAVSKNGDKDRLPPARGLARSWDEIAAGYLVIAQESLEYGWWEAIVLDRKGDSFTLRYRDYPHLPKFVRHRSGIALMCPNDDAKPAAPPEQA